MNKDMMVTLSDIREEMHLVKDRETGKYTEVMLIRDEKDLKRFMSEYGITEKPETEY